MQQRRNLILAGSAAVLLTAVSSGCTALAQDTNVPTFEVDPTWPMPLEYPYILGPVSGVDIAPDGNILIVHHDAGFNSINEINSVTGTGTCCTPAPKVIEYAPDGRIIRQWGGEGNGYEWPAAAHGVAVDPEGNVWIGGGVAVVGGSFGRGGTEVIDSHILKFTRDGQHIATFGTPGQGAANAHSPTAFAGAARFAFDADANEVYVADGYANRRVAVLDMTTGELKRQWGAYGNEPDASDLGEYDPAAAPAQQFRSVTCVEIANDGLVYVCDRGNNRIQVFQKDGTFVREQVIMPNTRSLGAVWDVAFSPDSNQRYLYVADGMNERVHILERESLEVRTSFGTGGRIPGTFHELGSVAVDAQGNIYTAEDGQGRRLQKFVNTGTGPVTAENLGILWPAR